MDSITTLHQHYFNKQMTAKLTKSFYIK